MDPSRAPALPGCPLAVALSAGHLPGCGVRREGPSFQVRVDPLSGRLTWRKQLREVNLRSPGGEASLLLQRCHLKDWVLENGLRWDLAAFERAGRRLLLIVFEGEIVGEGYLKFQGVDGWLLPEAAFFSVFSRLRPQVGDFIELSADPHGEGVPRSHRYPFVMELKLHLNGGAGMPPLEGDPVPKALKHCYEEPSSLGASSDGTEGAEGQQEEEEEEGAAKPRQRRRKEARRTWVHDWAQREVAEEGVHISRSPECCQPGVSDEDASSDGGELNDGQESGGGGGFPSRRRDRDRGTPAPLDRGLPQTFEDWRPSAEAPEALLGGGELQAQAQQPQQPQRRLADCRGQPAAARMGGLEEELIQVKQEQSAEVEETAPAAGAAHAAAAGGSGARRLSWGAAKGARSVAKRRRRSAVHLRSICYTHNTPQQQEAAAAGDVAMPSVAASGLHGERALCPSDPDAPMTGVQAAAAPRQASPAGAPGQQQQAEQVQEHRVQPVPLQQPAASVPDTEEVDIMDEGPEVDRPLGSCAPFEAPPARAPAPAPAPAAPAPAPAPAPAAPAGDWAVLTPAAARKLALELGAALGAGDAAAACEALLALDLYFLSDRQRYGAVLPAMQALVLRAAGGPAPGDPFFRLVGHLVQALGVTSDLGVVGQRAVVVSRLLG